jgi:uncharacterized caspase-like protein
MRNLINKLVFICIMSVAGFAWAAGGKDDQAQPSGSPQKLALVIGNGIYENAPKLPNALNDASDMCAALRNIGFNATCKSDISSKRQFKEVLYDFTEQISKGAVVLFYFAGHGVEIEGVNYLIPTKAALMTKSDIDDESIQLYYVLREFSARRASLNIFVLDACRDNPFLNPLRDYVPRLGFATQLDIPGNSILAVSTGANQVSLDGDGRNGTFTKNILHALATPNIPVADMFQQAMWSTTAESGRKGKTQNPMVAFSFHGKYCFGGCAGDPPVNNALTGEQEEIIKKREELARLQASIDEAKAKQQQIEAERQASIAQAKAKQQEIESERQALLNKEAEIKNSRNVVETSGSRAVESDAAKQALVSKEREANSILQNINDASEKLKELENTKNSLLARQQEINQLRESIEAQERSIKKSPETRLDNGGRARRSRYETAVTPTF